MTDLWAMVKVTIWGGIIFGLMCWMGGCMMKAEQIEVAKEQAACIKEGGSYFKHPKRSSLNGCIFGE